MNPSAPDWILKFFNLFNREELVERYENDREFYNALRKSGFIYGISVSMLTGQNPGTLKMTRNEMTKVNLFHALIYHFFKQNGEASDQEAIQNILVFYKELEKGKTGFFHKFSLSHSAVHSLEHILSARLQEANTLIKKNSLSLLTHALMFLDVLAYRHWLNDPKITKKVYRELEKGVLNYCFFTLKSKQKKSKYDQLLIELYESSSGYVLDKTPDASSAFLETTKYLNQADAAEKKYILDMCSLTIWEDLKMDETEYQYLLEIINILDFPEKELEESLADLRVF